ncbi:MAG: response regulator [Candidatus Omnitrophica bacterium]|nr:response regulator [Candidatus Omnitrophota bacterium]
MSHEIRTPMNAIIGFSDLLQGTNLDEVQKDYAETIKSSGDVLLVLINDILDISKIEAGSVRFEKISFNLEYLCGTVLKMMQSKVQGRNVELLLEYRSGTPTHFMGDPTRIRQVLTNLVGNAIKFTEQGEIRVIVKASELHKEQSSLGAIEICVKDTGIGIPANKLDDVFELFTQADDSTTRKYGGTGLGLPISRTLAQKMGGDITVRSQYGKGSEFIFSLQLEVAQFITKDEISLIDEVSLKGKKIVVVDNNEESLKLIDSYCKSIDMHMMFVASSADKLLTWLGGQQDLPDIIISDIMMPDMSGVALVERLLKEERYAGIKFIAHTSDARPGAAAEAQKAGFDGFLAKPFLRQELINVLQVVLADDKKKKKIVTRHTAEELSIKGVRVLVVEDKMANQKLIKVYLDMYGCVSDFANDGQQAIDKLKDNTYDICLMDLQMPVLGGIEATRIIRAEINKDIPIIALTAAAMKEDEEKALQSGMSDYLTKPIDRNKLRGQILKWTKE